MQPGRPGTKKSCATSAAPPESRRSVNRPKLAEAAFSPNATGATRIGELNAIVHPAVIRHEDEWMEAGKAVAIHAGSP